MNNKDKKDYCSELFLTKKEMNVNIDNEKLKTKKIEMDSCSRLYSDHDYNKKECGK